MTTAVPRTGPGHEDDTGVVAASTFSADLSVQVTSLEATFPPLECRVENFQNARNTFPLKRGRGNNLHISALLDATDVPSDSFLRSSNILMCCILERTRKGLPPRMFIGINRGRTSEDEKSPANPRGPMGLTVEA